MIVIYNILFKIRKINRADYQLKADSSNKTKIPSTF